MIIGSKADKIIIPEEFDNDLYEFIGRYDMVVMSLYYDADYEDQYIGFTVNEVLISDLNQKWLNGVIELGKKFEKITNTPASLIGTQDIY